MLKVQKVGIARTENKIIGTKLRWDALYHAMNWSKVFWGIRKSPVKYCRRITVAKVKTTLAGTNKLSPENYLHVTNMKIGLFESVKVVENSHMQNLRLRRVSASSDCVAANAAFNSLSDLNALIEGVAPSKKLRRNNNFEAKVQTDQKQSLDELLNWFSPCDLDPNA